jgi:hypothetical protein
MFFGVDGFVAEHQSGKVHPELVGRNVGTDGITEFALIAEIHHFLMDRERQTLQGFGLPMYVIAGTGCMVGNGGVFVEGIDSLSLPFGNRFFGGSCGGIQRVDRIKQCRERRTKIPTQTTTITDFENPLFFLDQRLPAPIILFSGIGDVVRQAELQLFSGKKRFF